MLQLDEAGVVADPGAGRRIRQSRASSFWAS